MASLFDFAAERAAIASGLPLSQELLRVQGKDAPAAGPLFNDVEPAGWFCICGGFIGPKARGICDGCGL